MLTINLKLRRNLCKLKQKDVAKNLGITYQQYQKYEYGYITPGLERFLKICKILNVEIQKINEALLIDYFITRQEDREKIIKEIYTQLH